MAISYEKKTQIRAEVNKRIVMRGSFEIIKLTSDEYDFLNIQADKYDFFKSLKQAAEKYHGSLSFNQFVYIYDGYKEQKDFSDVGYKELKLQIKENKDIFIEVYIVERKKITWKPKADWDTGEGILIIGKNGIRKVTFWENKKLEEENIEEGKIYRIGAKVKEVNKKEISIEKIKNIIKAEVETD